MVGKSAHPRDLKRVKVLPMHHRSNKQAWTAEWCENHIKVEALWSCHEVRLLEDCKIILLLDNCSAHPHPGSNVFVSRNVFATFFPTSCTLLVQPMDQGIICSMKCSYISNFMHYMVNSDSHACEHNSFKKEFNIKNCIFFTCMGIGVCQSLSVFSDRTQRMITLKVSEYQVRSKQQNFYYMPRV